MGKYENHEKQFDAKINWKCELLRYWQTPALKLID
jgi:hypothetical protein